MDSQQEDDSRRSSEDVIVPMESTPIGHGSAPREGFCPNDVALLEQDRPPTRLIRSLSSASSVFYQTMVVEKPTRVLSLGLVLPIYYFLTGGGQAGIELVVASGGPLLGLVMLIIFPLFISIPFSFVISDMCVTFPEDGGFVIWISNAFGPFWGFQGGYWAWISGVLNNALYPRLLLAALTTYVGAIGIPLFEYALMVAIVVFLALPTLFGVRIVGQTMVVLTVMVVVPVVVSTIWSFAEPSHYELLLEVPGSAVDGSRNLTLANRGTIDWKTLITTVFWSYDGIYLVSLFGGRVDRPEHTYPRAIFITLFLTVISYILPLVGAIVVDKMDWREFQDGSMTKIAQRVGGSFLHSVVILSRVSMTGGRFTAGTFCQCYQINGMAEQDLLPIILTKPHPLFETPYYALLLNTIPVLFLLTFNFQLLLRAVNCLSAALQILIVLAALKLRIEHSTPKSNGKFPGGNPMMILSMVIPMLVMACVLVLTITTPTAGFLVVGVVYAAFNFG